MLAGGSSSRFGEDKGILELAGKPLIKHVVDAVHDIVDKVIIVTSTQERVAKYAEIVRSDVQFITDMCESNSPLVGALTGFKFAQGDYALLIPFDMPFVSVAVISLLFDLCLGKNAVIPRWPNGHIEPLHAVYHVKAALDAAQSAIAEGMLSMRDMIDRLRGVRYISTLVVQQFDANLRTFFNVNTPLDLKRAATIFKASKV
ncbi:MAG: molybdenum cofactor guanylyltransferase [Candidatus Bathyarchaeia archaeon]